MSSQSFKFLWHATDKTGKRILCVLKEADEALAEK